MPSNRQRIAAMKARERRNARERELLEQQKQQQKEMAETFSGVSVRSSTLSTASLNATTATKKKSIDRNTTPDNNDDTGSPSKSLESQSERRKSPLDKILLRTNSNKQKLTPTAKRRLEINHDDWIDDDISSKNSSKTKPIPIEKKTKKLPQKAKEVSSSDSESDADDLMELWRKSAVGKESSTKDQKPPPRIIKDKESTTNDNNDGDASKEEQVDSSSDEQEPAPRIEKKQIIKRLYNVGNRGMPSSFSSEEEEDSDRDSSETDKNAVVRNPFTIAKEERQAALAAMKAAKPPNKEDDDDLWDDNDDLDAPKEINTETTKKKSTRKSRKPSNTTSSPSAGRDSSCGYAEYTQGGDWWLATDDDDLKYKLKRWIKRTDEDALQSILKPQLENPFFKPGPLEPFVLGEGTETVHQVPAAISRYLGPYQKEGIQFMHRCLSSKTGVILGDDMGLGKTIQTIALLCALFEKTGTGLDILKTKQRNDLIVERTSAVEREEKKAILEGTYTGPKPMDTTDLKFSPWWPTLIVVPPSIVDNWKRELNDWANFAVAAFVGGGSTDRDRELKKIYTGEAELMIASQSMFQGKSSFKDLLKIPWKLVLVDEFHKFKNPKAHLAENLRALKYEHRCLVVGMTGTLMSNNHEELWNLVDLVETNFFGKCEEFKNNTARPIALGRQKNADQETRDRAAQKSDALNKKLYRIFIQRMKEEVAKDLLPEKAETFLLCELSDIQKKIYEQILSLPDVQNMRLGSCPCDCGINQSFYKKYIKIPNASDRIKYCRENKDNIVKRAQCCYRVPENPHQDESGAMTIDPDAVLWRFLNGHEEDDLEGCERCPYCITFPTIAKLNKLCSHACSMQARQQDGYKQVGTTQHTQYTKELQFAQVAIPQDILHKLPGGHIRQPGVLDNHFALSGKIKALHKLLNQFRKEESQVLIFSFSTQTLDLIQNYVISQNYKFERIDGSVESKKRQGICDRFNKDPSIFLFLLSTKATGLGLNLVAANKVIIFDVEWNPSWDEQAQDRAFRIGQRREVQVIRLIAKGTIDELKYFRQVYKLHLKQETLDTHDDSKTKTKAPRLFRAVQGDKDRKGELFGIENLMKFKPDGSFFDGLWKSKDAKGSKKKKKDEIEVHEAPDLTSGTLCIQKCEEVLDTDITAAYLAEKTKNGVENEWMSRATAQGGAPAAGVASGRAASAHQQKPRAKKTGTKSETAQGSVALNENESDGEGEMGAYTQNVCAMATQVGKIRGNHRMGNLQEDIAMAPSKARNADESVAETSDADPGASEEAAPNVVQNAYESDGESSLDLENAGVNHHDLFDDEVGEAVSEEEEERGANSQNVILAFEGIHGNMQLPENPQDAEEEFDERPPSAPAIVQFANNGEPARQESRARGNVQNGEIPNHNAQDSRDFHSASHQNEQEVDDRESFFSSRIARAPRMNRPAASVSSSANQGVVSTSGTASVPQPRVAASRASKEGLPAMPDATDAGSAAKPPPTIQNSITEQNAIEDESTAMDRAFSSMKNKKCSSTKRPAIALVGKTSSEIASKSGAKLDFMLPSYKKRKKRKK